MGLGFPGLSCFVGRRIVRVFECLGFSGLRVLLEGKSTSNHSPITWPCRLRPKQKPKQGLEFRV